MDGTESGTALRDRYRNERRIEMVYEDQRFFDVRRWMIGPQAYHDVHGVQIVISSTQIIQQPVFLSLHPL